MSKDCPNCPAFGKHCPHKVNGDPYFYDCYLTVAELEKEIERLKKTYRKQRNKRIDDLQKENAELKSLKDVADLIRLNNSHIVAMAQLNNNNVALRKENAKLKEKESTIHTLDVLHKEAVRKYGEVNDQLTKAKELLAKWVELFKPKGGNMPPTPIQVNTEQFLSEVEK